MPGRDYAPFTEYNIISLLEFIFQDDFDVLMNLTRMVRYGNPEFIPYIPRDPGRRNRLLNELREFHAATAI